MVENKTNIDSSKKEKKRLTVFGVEFVYLYLFGIIFAFIGWVVENIVQIIAKGTIDCRFQLLPFIWVYSLIPFAFQVFFGDLDNIAPFGRRIFKRESTRNKVFSNILCAFIMCLAVFVGELVVGNLWDYMFGVSLWNYSNTPLNITKYASIFTAVGFGVGTYVIFRFIYKPLFNLVRKKVKFKTAKIICCTLGVAILLDTIIMTIYIIVTHKLPVYWRIHFR